MENVVSWGNHIHLYVMPKDVVIKAYRDGGYGHYLLDFSIQDEGLRVYFILFYLIHYIHHLIQRRNNFPPPVKEILGLLSGTSEVNLG